MLRAEEHERLQRLRRAIDFGGCACRVDEIFNAQYGSGREEFQASLNAKFEIVKIIESIRKQLRGDCTFGSKKSGLEALRNIGRSVVDAPDTLGYEVRKEFQYQTDLTDGMLEILRGMSVVERRDMALNMTAKGRFVHRLCDLRDATAGFNIFEGLEDTIEMLEESLLDEDGGYDEEENADQNQEDEGEEDEDEDD